VLTSKPMTHFRTASCEKPGRLLANLANDEEQSLHEVTKIGANEIQEQPELWIEVAANGTNLPTEETKWWEKALTGLLDLRIASLDRVAAYVLQTRSALVDEGL